MIRVSTNTIFDQGVFNMQRGTAVLVSSGSDRRPAAASARRPMTRSPRRARWKWSNPQAINQQYIAQRRQRAPTALGLEENALTRSRPCCRT